MLNTPCLFCTGLEQCKARDEEMKEGAEEEGGPESSSSARDLLIKRKLSAVSLGQAISVLGAYAGKSQPSDVEEAPQVKRLPEPILPSTQTK